MALVKGAALPRTLTRSNSLTAFLGDDRGGRPPKEITIDKHLKHTMLTPFLNYFVHIHPDSQSRNPDFSATSKCKTCTSLSWLKVRSKRLDPRRLDHLSQPSRAQKSPAEANCPPVYSYNHLSTRPSCTQKPSRTPIYPQDAARSWHRPATSRRRHWRPNRTGC